MNNHVESDGIKTDFFLGDLEQRAHNKNTMLALYHQSKHLYGIRPTLNDLEKLSNVGEVVVGGVELAFNSSDSKAFINGSSVDVEPLFQGLENSTDFDYNKQRKAYLEGIITFQSMYIDYDSKGSADALGNEHNTAFNTKKVADALKELAPDLEDINPNNFFKTDMTLMQKIRLMSSQIDTIKADVKKTSHKLAIEEKKAIKQPLIDIQTAQSVKDILSGAIDPMEATKRDKTHEIDPNHLYVQTVLKGTKGINDTKNFSISQLKPLPKDYETVQTISQRAKSINYGDNDSEISILAKQLISFQSAKGIILNAPKVDFSHGIDLERLFVSTKRLAGAEMIDGKSCVMDANEKYRNVNAGDFALPRSSLLNKPIKTYKSIALTVGASAAGAISTALKAHDDILVIDALREDNVNQVLFDIRENYNTPISVFTSNKAINDFLESNKDTNLTSNLSKDKGWGEIGIDALRADRFDEFAKVVESKVKTATTHEPTQADKPSIRASLNVDPLANANHHETPPTNPNNHRNQMGL